MKRFVSVFLVLVLMLGLVPSLAMASSNTLEPVTLIWYFPGAWPAPDQEVVFAEVNKLLQAKINTTIDFRPLTYADYNEKMSTVISGSDDWDICFTANWLLNYGLYASKGAFLDMTDLLPKYMPETYKQVPEVFWKAAQIKGRNYSVINEQISARIADVTIPTEFLTETGYDLSRDFVPGDIRSLDSFLAKMHEKYPEKYFLTDIANQQEYLNQEWLNGFVTPGAIDVATGSTTVVNQFKTDAFKKLIGDLRYFNEQGYMDADRRIAIDVGREESKEKLQTVAMNGTYKPGVDLITTDMLGFPCTVIPSGKPMLTTGGIIATMTTINAKSKNPERAMMALELFNSNAEGAPHNSFYDTLCRGVEGTHFTYTDDGHIQKTQQGIDKYNVVMDWMWASNFQTTPDVGMDLNIWDETRKMNTEATASPLCGFLFDSEPVKSEAAACSAVAQEYKKPMELGMLSEADYQTFLDKMDAAGADAIIAEMQKQVDAWLAAK